MEEGGDSGRHGQAGVGQEGQALGVCTCSGGGRLEACTWATACWEEEEVVGRLSSSHCSRRRKEEGEILEIFGLFSSLPYLPSPSSLFSSFWWENFTNFPCILSSLLLLGQAGRL